MPINQLKAIEKKFWRGSANNPLTIWATPRCFGQQTGKVKNEHIFVVETKFQSMELNVDRLLINSSIIATVLFYESVGFLILGNDLVLWERFFYRVDTE